MLQLGLISLDYPESLASIFEAADKRNLQYVELYLGDYLQPDQAETVRDLAKRHGVRIASISSLAKLNQAEDDLPIHEALIRGSIRLAAAVGSPYATFMYGGNATMERGPAQERFLKRIAPLVNEAAGQGVVLLLENVFSRVPPGDLDQADRTAELFERLDQRHVGLNFDLSNYAIAGDEAYPYAYHRLRPYIRYMHLRDAVKYVPEFHGELDGRRVLTDHQRGPHISVPIGTGQINFNAFLAELTADGYNGAVALEPFAYGHQRESWLDQSLAYLSDRGLHAGRK